MVNEIKLVIKDPSRTLKVITAGINKLSSVSCLIESLQTFQRNSNEALTGLIADACINKSSIMEEDCADEENDELSEDEDVTVTPTKRKK